MWLPIVAHDKLVLTSSYDLKKRTVESILPSFRNKPTRHVFIRPRYFLAAGSKPICSSGVSFCPHQAAFDLYGYQTLMKS